MAQAMVANLPTQPSQRGRFLDHGLQTLQSVETRWSVELETQKAHVEQTTWAHRFFLAACELWSANGAECCGG